MCVKLNQSILKHLGCHLDFISFEVSILSHSRSIGSVHMLYNSDGVGGAFRLTYTVIIHGGWWFRILLPNSYGNF